MSRVWIIKRIDFIRIKRDLVCDLVKKSIHAYVLLTVTQSGICPASLSGSSRSHVVNVVGWGSVSVHT